MLLSYKNAQRVLERFFHFCVSTTGHRNFWIEKGRTYFLDVSKRPHKDGAVTGSLYKRVGSFRIEGDGRVSRGPNVLKECEVATLDSDLQSAFIPKEEYQRK